MLRSPRNGFCTVNKMMVAQRIFYPLFHFKVFAGKYKLPGMG